MDKHKQQALVWRLFQEHLGVSRSPQLLQSPVFHQVTHFHCSPNPSPTKCLGILPCSFQSDEPHSSQRSSEHDYADLKTQQALSKHSAPQRAGCKSPPCLLGCKTASNAGSKCGQVHENLKENTHCMPRDTGNPLFL